MAIAQGRTSQSFRALARSPALRRMLAAFLIFNATELATWVAVLVWAYGVGGAATAGLIAVAQLIPSTLLAPFLSQIGDRMRRDRALTVGFGSQAITFGLTATALTLNWPAVAVYITATLAAISVTITRPVHYASLPDVAETPEELTAANALSSSVEGFGGFGGPLVTAGLLAVSGPGLVFWSAMAATLGAAVLTLNLPMRLAQVRTERWSVLDNAKEGFAAVKQAHGTGRVTLIFGSQFLVLGALDILIVVLGLEVLRLDDSGPGTLASGLGIGGLVGAAGTAMLVNRRRMAPAVVGGLVGLGLPLALIAVLAYGLAPAFALLALAGAGKSFVDVAGRTLLQRITPDRVLARVFGLQESLMMAGLAVGAAVAPVLIGWSSGRGAFFIMGALVIAVGLTQWLALLRLDSISILPGPGFELLAAIPMFSVLEQPDIEHLSRELVWMQAPAGAVVIKEGEAGDHFYLVESGIVSILKSGHEVNQLGRGSYFGETALLRNIPRTATVVAVTDADLYALDRRPFLEAVTGSPSSTVEAQRVMEERAGDSEPLADGL